MAKLKEKAAEAAAPDTTFWVYVVQCADATLYTGVARSIEKRIAEHNGAGNRGARYTAARRPVQLVYAAQFANRSQAQQEEARIKALTRGEKQILILAHALAGKRTRSRPVPNVTAARKVRSRRSAVPG